MSFVPRKLKSKKFDGFIEVDSYYAKELTFLAKAVCTNDWRQYMQYLHVEPSDAPDDRADKTPARLRGVTTDGRRLHIVDPLPDALVAVHGMKVGDYRVLKSGKVCQLARYEDGTTEEFVKYRHAIPDSPVTHSAQFSGIDLKAGRGFPELLSMFRNFPEPTACNFNFLADLGFGEAWDVEWRGTQKALVFKYKNRTALIMPMEAE